MASPGFIAACCLGNKSVFIDSDIPRNHQLLQEKAVSGVSLTFAALSIFGLIVILYPWRCARKQSPRRLSQHLQGPNLNHVVYCIIAAAVLGNIGIIVRSGLWLHGYFPDPQDKIFRDFNHVFCAVTSVWVQYFFLAEVFWHLSYGLEAYMISHGTTCSRWILHITGWICPACFTAMGSYVAYQPSLDSCGAQHPVQMGVLYILILVPVFTIFIINIVIFRKTSMSVKRSLILHFGRYSTQERKIVESIQLKFISFSVTYLISWMPNLLNGILINVLDGNSDSFVLALLVLEDERIIGKSGNVVPCKYVLASSITSVFNPCEVLLLIMVLWGWPPSVWYKITRSPDYEEIGQGTINTRQRSKSRSRSRSRLFTLWTKSRDQENDPLLSFSNNSNL